MTNATSLRRRRDLTQILTDGLAVYKTPRLITKLLILALPGVLLGIINVWGATSVPPPASGLVAWLIWFLEAALIGSSAIFAIDQTDRGNLVSIKQSLLKAWYHVPDLVAAAAISIATIAAFCITVVGIPWAVARYVRWAFASQAIMIDGQEGKPALAFSASLVEGRTWPTFGILILIELTVSVPAIVITLLVNHTVHGLPAGSLGILLTALSFPFRVMARTLLFYDLKMRKALA